MPKKKIRNAAYYEDRLRKDHPVVHADLLAGKYPSVRQAAAAAGLIRLPTPLDALKREWKRAGSAEQIEFVRWLKAGAPAAIPTPPKIVDRDNRLTTHAAKFLAEWVDKHKSKPGRIMKDIGLKVFDWRLANAIDHGRVLPLEVVDKLQPWMMANGFKR